MEKENAAVERGCKERVQIECQLKRQNDIHLTHETHCGHLSIKEGRRGGVIRARRVASTARYSGLARRRLTTLDTFRALNDGGTEACERILGELGRGLGCEVR